MLVKNIRCRLLLVQKESKTGGGHLHLFIYEESAYADIENT